MKKKAFTLAEVLITLTIIGVVAAINIPTLLNSVDDSKFKVAWKKSFADISQVSRSILMDEGSFKGLCSHWNSNCFKDILVAKFNTLKDVNHGQGAGNCWHEVGDFYYLNGATIDNWGNSACFALNNGQLFFVAYMSEGCPESWIGKPTCALLYADVNGFDGPNTLGKDIQGVGRDDR